VTSDASIPDKKENSFYIPPAGGPAVKEKPLPEIQKGEDWSGLAIIVLGTIMLVAGFQLFLVIMQLINTWIADDLVPVFSAAFDVVIIAGGLWLIRKYVQKK
jgi:hypothetical protein